MLAAARELQIPLLAVMLLGGCAAKAWRVLRSRSMKAAFDPAGLFPLRLHRPIMMAMFATEFVLGLGLIATARKIGTTDPGLPARVDEELAEQIQKTKHRQRVETALRGQAAYVLTADIQAAVVVCDAWAPEHLEVQTADAAKVAAKVRNAGAIFVGPYSPVSLGDYLAGSNHVLPTGGTARHTSGLSVYPYLKVVNVIECDRDSLAAVAPRVDALGGAEDLAAHVAAVRVRVPETEGSQ